MSKPEKTYRVVVVVVDGIAAPGIMLDYADAFRKLGHEVFLLDTRIMSAMSSDEEKIQFFDEARKELLHFQADFAVGYNNSIFITLPPHHPAEHFFEALQIDYVSLYYDNPLLTKFVSSSLTMHSPRYTVFIWDRGYLAAFRRVHKKEAFYLPLATNPEVFRPLAPVDEYVADVSFIGSVSTVHDYDHERREGEWHGWLVQFARDVVGAWQANQSMTVDGVIASFRDGFAAETRQAFDAFTLTDDFSLFLSSVYDEIGKLSRMAAIQALPADRKIHVYGGTGWGSLVKANLHVTGPVDYHSEAPLVYNSSRINLNVTSAQLSNAVNQRVFDVPACGAFLLTDYRPALAELFEVDKEIVCYRNFAELNTMTAHFLAHPDHRQEIAARARERVLAQHTYRHRAQRIIDLFNYRAAF